jgi:hypothetical protein
MNLKKQVCRLLLKLQTYQLLVHSELIGVQRDIIDVCMILLSLLITCMPIM